MPAPRDTDRRPGAARARTGEHVYLATGPVRLQPPTEDSGLPGRLSETATPLEDLIPIAVAIAAGCERCAETLVNRALERGGGKPLVGRTLAIVAAVRSRSCFAQAVGPEVIARMDGPLEAGKKALGLAGAGGRGFARNRDGRVHHGGERGVPRGRS